MMKKHRNIVLFLVKFFVVYFLLFISYAVYLQKSQKREDGFSCSSITVQVAKQTSKLLTFSGYKNQFIQHDKEMSIKLLIDGKYVSRVIEGCNSISIIILFLAFIIAFPGSLKATVLFGLLGSLLIYIINIFRIAFLSVMLYQFPEEQVLLHNVVFPLIIYGTTFLLWVLWVQKFSNYKKWKLN